jgi:ATP-dependent helicase Lhr and Lhr-like helicase
LDYFLGNRSARWLDVTTLSSSARDVARFLEQRGASFVADIARGAGLLKIKVEEALWELVAQGLATGDGIAGLRVLLLPEHKRQGKRHNLRVISGGRSAARMMPVGRWSLWSNQNGDAEVNSEQIVERQARQLLERYGVVFRDLLAREANLPPWRTLLATYRRLEARGEIRGGRFVSGFVGEQFALPVAIERLRAERRADDKQQPFIISAADPLNLVGILTPGARVSPYSNQVIAYQNGLPIQVGPLGSVLSSLQPHHAGEKP